MIPLLLVAATLSGEVRERGTRDPVPYAVVIASGSGGTVRAESDEKGEFALELAPGAWNITVLAGEYLRFETHETVQGAVRVRYFLERRRYGRYETIVRGKPAREEVERHSRIKGEF